MVAAENIKTEADLLLLIGGIRSGMNATPKQASDVYQAICHFPVITGSLHHDGKAVQNPGFIDRYIGVAKTPPAQTDDIPARLILHFGWCSHVDFAAIPAVLAKLPFDLLCAVFEWRLLPGQTAPNRNQKNQTAEEKSGSTDDQRCAHGIHNKIPKRQLSGRPTPAQRAG
jgi:hypothetical protein